MRRVSLLALLTLPVAAIAATAAPPSGAQGTTTPVLRISDADLVWGDVQIGTTDVRTVTVSNSGGGSFKVGPSRIVGGDEADFAVSSNGCAGKTLAAGQTCQITVRFSPTDQSTRVSHLSVPTDVQDCVSYVNLAGTGNAPGTTGPDRNDRRGGFGRQCPGAKTSTDTTTSPTTPAPSTGVLGTSDGGGGTICKSGRKLRIHIRAPKGRAFKAGSLTVRTKGRAFTVRKAKSRRRAGQYYSDLSFAGLKVGRYKVKVRGTLTSGARYARNRYFVTCISGKTP